MQVGPEAPPLRREGLHSLDVLQQAVWILDLERHQLWWANRAAVRLLSAESMEALLGRGQALGASDAGCRSENPPEVPQAGPVRHERWTLYPEGRPPLHARCACSSIQIQDPPGTSPRSALLVEAAPLEDASAETERRSLEAFHQTGVMLAMFSERGRPLLRNPAALRAYGEGAALAGDADGFAALFVQPEEALRARDQLEAGGVYVADAEVLAQRGKRWHTLEVRSMRDPISGEGALLLSARDISERRQHQHAALHQQRELERQAEDLRALAARLEESRREAVSLKEKAEAASRAKSSFLAIMSHELRTPLTGVLGLTDLLGQSQLDPEQHRLLATLRSSASTLLELLNDVLDFSKIEAGKLELESVPFSPRSVVQEVLELCAAPAMLRGLTLESIYDEGLPHYLRGDPRRLRQILLNLVGNALKFTPEGRIEVHVRRVWQHASHIRLRFEVHDQGVGIEPDQQARLFEPFTQVDPTSTRRHGGTGLGLSIARALCERMGGTIGVVSAPGKGSRFWFTVELPRVERPRRVQPSGVPNLIPPEWLELLQGTQVLLAEDNAVNRMLLQRMLEKWGCVVEHAPNGLAAVEAAKARDYSIILMDLHMPQMDGIEAARQIRAFPAERPRVPIVALTADVLSETVSSPLRWQMDASVTKPVEWKQLARTMVRLLSPSSSE